MVYISSLFEFPSTRGQFAHSLVAGMAIAGVGAGINELTALAITSELAPTAKRGKYVAVLVFTILPFCPAVLWAQLIAYHSTWRWIGLIYAVWAFIGLLLTACFYFPPPRVNSGSLSRREVLARVDWVGGVLSISGMILFIASLVWGGNQVGFTVALATCIITLPHTDNNTVRLD